MPISETQVGVPGKSFDLQLQNFYAQNITIKIGLVNINTSPMLLKSYLKKK